MYESIVLFVGLLFVVLIPWLIMEINRDKKRIKALAPVVLNIATISKQSNSQIEGVFRHAGFSIKYLGPNDGQPFVLNMFMYSARPFFYLDLRKENFDTRISKKIGFVREVEVGDEEFDAAFLLRTEARDRCKVYFSDEAKRTLVSTMYSLGYTLAFSTQGILMTIPLQTNTPLPAIDQKKLSKCLESLRLLIDDN